MNKLNVLTYNYLPWSHPKNWFSNIAQFFRNIKYAYQRITRGYCEQDIWNLNNYYSELFYQSLNKLADIAYSYPGRDKFSDESGGYDAWVEYLKEMAEHFLNTQEWNEDVPINRAVSEAFDKMQLYISGMEFEATDDGYHMLVEHYTDENAYKAAREEWLKLENKAAEFRESEKNKAFKMMSDYFFDLWD